MTRISYVVMFLAFAVGLALFCPNPGFAHEGEHSKKATITGQVVGTTCYLVHESKGEQHLECATECAEKGIPLAILESGSGQLYLPLASCHHAAANGQLMPFIEKKVKVTGVVIEKNGMKAIMMEKVEAAD